MSEASVLQPDRLPVTAEWIARDLATLGLATGQVVITHSSLSALGWVVGGANAVVQALLQTLTPAGTLVMPTHSTDNSEPSYWQNPPIPKSWWQTVRDHMPPYDPHTSVTRMMGRIVDVFRTVPGVRRSAHPQHSFAALGPHADFITRDHALEDAMGERSPLARVYDLDGYVLLLGVPHGNNTSLHLAECRADWPGKTREQQGAAVRVDGERRWVTFSSLAYNADDFDALGAAYERGYNTNDPDTGVCIGTVGYATARLMRQRPLIDYAVQWIARHRGG